MLFHNFLDRLAYACIRHLYVEHGADCGCYVGDVCDACGGSVLHVPSHEDQWDVCVVGVPQSVCGTFEVALIVGGVDVGLRYDEYVAAALVVVSVDGPFAQQCGYGLVQHPQQVLALFPIDGPSAATCALADDELVLALDGIQDPGNLGTIIRIADWFGIQRIYCSTDTADAYNPKVVQATMGSIARVSIYYTDLRQFIANRPEGMPVYGTLLDGENLYAQQKENRGIIVMGNEGRGISPEIIPLLTHRLLIPPYPADRRTAESLNVATATAIVCAEMRRG